VHRKLAAARRANVTGKARSASAMRLAIANGAESEPASRKDAALLWHCPHLVLDGLRLVAEAIGASGACLYLHRGQHDALARALRERATAGLGTRHEVNIVTAPPRFLAGQETALVNRVAGGPAVPTFTPPRVPDLGIAVHNVETLAHLALIARYGPNWFREAGPPAEPGTMLVTVHTDPENPEVREIPIGTRLTELTAQATISRAQAVLIGGYHGTWLPAAAAADLTLDNRTLATQNATLGAGVIAILPDKVCGLKEAARVARYLAAESAGQCGPCLNGLPRIATALAQLAGRKPARKQREDTERWLSLVTNRGACHHPDGTARFVRSALTVFAAELRQHARGRCTATTRDPFLPLPPATQATPTTEADWT
jgi:NADH:ubiquinone oxidoreductase subunit F (NADH-binding)